MYIVLDTLYYNTFGRRNVFKRLESAKGRADELNDAFITNKFKVFELKEIE